MVSEVFLLWKTEPYIFYFDCLRILDEGVAVGDLVVIFDNVPCPFPDILAFALINPPLSLNRNSLPLEIPSLWFLLLFKELFFFLDSALFLIIKQFLWI